VHPTNLEGRVNKPGTTIDLAAASLHDLLAGHSVALVEERLRAYLVRQRWFGAKARMIGGVRVLPWVELPALPAALVFLEVTYADSGDPPDTYQLPLAFTTHAAADTIGAIAPASILATLNTPDGPTILHDATAREDVRQTLLALIESNSILTVTSNLGPGSSSLSARRSPVFTADRTAIPLPARVGSAEQSNTSIVYGDKFILKLFRRLQPGENPDTEVSRFLTEVAHFPNIPPFLGDIRLSSLATPSAPPTTLAMLQGLVANDGDGWQHTLAELARFYQSVATLHPALQIAEVRIPAGTSLSAAALLGRRTAELHLALATPTDDAAFAPELHTAADLGADAARIAAQITVALDALARVVPTLADPATAASAERVLSRRGQLLATAAAVAQIPPTDSGLRIRIHGDYHLGQLLCAHGDYIILDFEGEPARSLAERRTKQSPLRDVAGMLRSFSYAAHAGLDAFLQVNPSAHAALQPWAQAWTNAVSTEFLTAWRATLAANPRLSPQPPHADSLLHACLLEKALYELLYELNNRPTWLPIPLAGILALPPSKAASS
jgi:maltose alpha-D-glucosyltransferase/alpha-amylase